MPYRTGPGRRRRIDRDNNEVVPFIPPGEDLDDLGIADDVDRHGSHNRPPRPRPPVSKVETVGRVLGAALVVIICALLLALLVLGVIALYKAVL